MENNKIKKIKHNNKWFKITAISIAIGLVGIGGGVGVGYGIWYSKTTPTPTVPTLTLQLRTGSTILQHEGDTLIYDLKPNMDFKNFTGTSINLPNVESINESGIDGHPGPGYITWWDTDKDMHPSITDPTKEESISGIFWNDKNDITKGAFVRLHLNKDYDGTQAFLPFTCKVTIHDNNDKHPDAQAQQSFILAEDAGQSEVDNDFIKNVSTVEMGMDDNTTTTDIVSYLEASNTELTGTHALDDEFVSTNINSNQIAALLFIDTLEIQKNWLVDWNSRYGFTSSGSPGYTALPDLSSYSIDTRINVVNRVSESNSFDVSFEQDVQQLATNNFFNQIGNGMSGYFFGDMSNLITGYYAADLPSAWYSGNEVTIAQFVSSYANGGQNASWPILAGGLSSSVSLSSNINDLITGNLNCFYKTPFTQSTPWGSQVPSVHTDFTPLDIARLFWPNVNWEE